MAKKTVKQMTLSEFRATFPNETACRDYLTARRWPKGVRCPRCENAKVYALAKPHHWQCEQCAPNGYRFSVLVGTIFENTNIPLTIWFEVIYQMMTSKKGVSALQIHRTMGTRSYRTAWSMCHRIRAGMADESFRQLTGFVEMDEAYIGGKDKWKHHDKKGGGIHQAKQRLNLGDAPPTAANCRNPAFVESLCDVGWSNDSKCTKFIHDRTKITRSAASSSSTIPSANGGA